MEQVLRDNVSESNLRTAVCYVRMSTEHQKYSIENQSDALFKYAKNNNLTVTRIFSDAGRSGLSLKGRVGLAGLLEMVENGEADFEYILVYDVSRWGRFQDVDESAYYEYLCKKNGIRVLYCTEQFQNDGSPYTAVLKSLKRVMAAEYSRELSDKVFAGQCNLVRKGFRQGGTAGYGLRRMLIDENGNEKYTLEYMSHKAIQTDRVILVPGPQEEIDIINKIFHLFVIKRQNYGQISRRLNERGLLNDLGEKWSRKKIQGILTNEKYIGNNVYGKTSTKLASKISHNKPDSWVRADKVFTPIVPIRLFNKAQKLVKSAKSKMPDAVMLHLLEKLYKKHGHLSSSLINASKRTPYATTYSERFGSILNAYKLIGYEPSRNIIPDQIMLQKLYALYQKKGTLDLNIIDKAKNVPNSSTYIKRFGSIYEAYRLVGFNKKKPDTRESVMIEHLKRIYQEHDRLSSALIDADELAPHSRTYSKKFGSLSAAYELAGIK